MTDKEKDEMYTVLLKADPRLLSAATVSMLAVCEDFLPSEQFKDLYVMVRETVDSEVVPS